MNDQRQAKEIIARLSAMRDEWAKKYGVKDASQERRMVRDH